MRLAASRIIIALALVAIAAPMAAAARPRSVQPPILKASPTAQLAALHQAEAHARAAHAYRPPPGAHFSTTSLAVYARGSQPVPAASTTTKDPGGDFDYGAAAIGAGVAAVLVLLVSGSIVVARRRGQLQHS